MSEQNREQISTLMDGELGHQDAAHAIQILTSGHPEHRQTWWRFHLIGESLRGHLPPSVDPGLADRVMSVIRDEPAILAPRRTLVPYLKPAMGFAIAASVATVAIIGIRQASEVTPAAPLAPAVAVHQPVLIPRQVAARSGEPAIGHAHQPASVSENAESRLNRYLVNHNEYRTNTGVQGMLPYVSIVAHEVGE